MQFSAEVWPNSNEIFRLATRGANPYIGAQTKGSRFGKERASVVAVVKLGNEIAQLGEWIVPDQVSTLKKYYYRKVYV